MATIKINYGGTTYSMVKTSSKITTPSVKIDGGWIPCFKGNRFAEVTHGNQIYTLSPLKVNGYRMACGSRTAFNGTIYVHISYNIKCTVMGSTSALWTLEVHPVKTASTNISGYSCLLTNVIWDDYSTSRNGSQGGCPSGIDINQPLKATYSILNNGNVVKTGTINKNIYIKIQGKDAGDRTDRIAV